MKKNKRYSLYEKEIKRVKVVLNNFDIDGYKVKPKKDTNYDGIKVSSMFIFNNDLVEVLLRKKIKKKLDAYLQFLISVLDEDDTDSGHLLFALNDLDRYRHTVMNNYRVYLEKKYLKILLDKMALIEQELKSKIKFEIRDVINEQMKLDFEEPKKGKSR